MDVVEPGELVVVKQEGGRVQDQLRGGPGQEKMVKMKKMMTITTWSASPPPSWRGPRCQGPPSRQTPFRGFAD